MPYKQDWFIPQQVLYVKSAESVSYQEALTFDTEFTQLLEPAHHPVHLVLDLSLLTRFPLGLQNGHATTYQKHRNMGHVILISKNRSLHYIGALAVQFLKHTYRVSLTPQEARTYLKEREPHLNWAQANESLLR